VIVQVPASFARTWPGSRVHGALTVIDAGCALPVATVIAADWSAVIVDGAEIVMPCGSRTAATVADATAGSLQVSPACEAHNSHVPSPVTVRSPPPRVHGPVAVRLTGRPLSLTAVTAIVSSTVIVVGALIVIACAVVTRSMVTELLAGSHR
jgi:hypothetical protein